MTVSIVKAYVNDTADGWEVYPDRVPVLAGDLDISWGDPFFVHADDASALYEPNGSDWLSWGELDRSATVGYWQDDTTIVVPYLLVPFTSWGNYSGGTVERANCGAILEDHPDAFLPVGSSESVGHALAIRATQTISGDVASSLLHLNDCVEWDSDATLRVEMALTDECWGAYGSRDFREALESFLDPDGDESSPALSLIPDDDDALWDLWRDAAEDGAGDDCYCETATSVVFHHDDIVPAAAARLRGDYVSAMLSGSGQPVTQTFLPLF